MDDKTIDINNIVSPDQIEAQTDQLYKNVSVIAENVVTLLSILQTAVEKSNKEIAEASEDAKKFKVPAPAPNVFSKINATKSVTRKAEENYNANSSEGNKTNRKNARSAEANAALDITSDVLNGVGAITNGIASLASAGDKETKRVIENSAKLATGVGDIASGIASMNPAKMIQGALAIATSIMDLVDSKERRIIAEAQESIDKLKIAYDDLGESVADAYSTDASGLIGQQNDMLEKQKQLVEQQKEAQNSKKQEDPEAIENYDAQLKEINKQIEANAESARVAIFGTDLKSAINDFASAYMNAWASGEDRAQSQKDVVKKMVKGIIQEMLKADIAGQVDAMRKKIEGFMSDGFLSEGELAEIDKLGQEVGQTMEQKGKLYEKVLDDGAVENSDSLTGQIRGTVATEASVAELGGIFRGQYDKLSNISTKVDEGFTHLLEIARTNVAIEANTRQTATNTANTVNALALGFSNLKTELVAIKNNTAKDLGIYGN